ncbi:MAG: serpin family protein, partial [Polyangiaceae bacterium]|nr:serpin family protein [Polyangiaceae bacterium]
MRSALSTFILSSSLALPLFGCSGHASSGGGGDMTVAKSNVARIAVSSLPSDALPTAVTANNAFAADLYTRLAAGAPAKNLVVAPVSASLALGMSYAGAKGTTASQMATALHFSADPGTSIADGQNALSAALESRVATAQMQQQQLAGLPPNADASEPDVALRVVNSVWGQKGFPWLSSFLDIMAASYGSGVYLEDFADDAAQGTSDINDWVQTQTNGAIYPLLQQPLDSVTRMVLVNAVYLQLPWVTPFVAAGTTSGAFTCTDGSTVTTSYMQLVYEVPYVDDGQAQIIALALQGGISAVFTVPHADVSLATYEAGLTATSPALAIPASTSVVAAKIPKVDFTTATFSLVQPLQAMGMTQAFEPGAADFTGMCSATTCSGLYIDDVEQRAMIQVREEGVEAAASTAVVLRDSGAFNSTVSVTANRP